MIQAVIFDAYGTLFDVHGLRVALDALARGQGAALSKLWRERQIDYTRLYTLAGRYRKFFDLTGDALDYAAEALGVNLTPAARAGLLEGYRNLPTFAETLPTLQALKARGLKLAILTNGDPAMIQDAVDAAHLNDLLDYVLSVDRIGKYKVAPEAYTLGTTVLGAKAQDILFVSSNGWDVAGAGWFGYRTFWVNRQAAPLERLQHKPEGEGPSLEAVVAFLAKNP